MEITSVTCNSCGAALEVGPAARFVTCRYCGAQLEIKRTASAVFTEVLDSINKNTASMAEDLTAIRREQELERLDREWQLERAGFMSRDKQGNLHEPTAAGGMIGAAIAGGFGILWTIMAIAITSSAPAEGPFIIAKVIFPLFGILFTVGAIVTGLKTTGNASSFQQAQQDYERRRAQLLVQNREHADATPTRS